MKWYCFRFTKPNRYSYLGFVEAGHWGQAAEAARLAYPAVAKRAKHYPMPYGRLVFKAEPDARHSPRFARLIPLPKPSPTGVREMHTEDQWHHTDEAKLRSLAKQVIGLNIDDSTAEDILSQVEWYGFYPVVDASDNYTGEVAAADRPGEIIREKGIRLSKHNQHQGIA